MNTNTFALDDFIDECFLDNDELCRYYPGELDKALQGIVLIEGESFENPVKLSI